MTDGKVTISVHHGTLGLKKVVLEGTGEIALRQPALLKEGESKEFDMVK